MLILAVALSALALGVAGAALALAVAGPVRKARDGGDGSCCPGGTEESSPCPEKEKRAEEAEQRRKEGLANMMDYDPFRKGEDE